MDKKILLTLALGILSIAGISYFAVGVLTSEPVIADEYVAQFVSGTEYQAGEVGQTVVRLSDRRGIGVIADSCNVTIWYPDKTLWKNYTAMVEDGADGSWYLEWTTTTQTGVYEEYAECVKGGITYGVSDSFHVSEALTALNTSLDEPVLVMVS